MEQNSMYDWPDYYDWTSTGLDHDITYYVELAKQYGGPVLELGCGTGRCTLAIAREGIPVVGVDISANMLERAQQKAESLGLAHQVEWIESDMAKLDLKERRFPLIIIPYRSFSHLIQVQDQLATLKRIYRHLSNDGLFAMNIFSPQMDQLIDIDGKYAFRGTFPIPGGREEVEVYDYTEVDSFYQILYVIRYFEHFDEHGKSLCRIKSDMRIRYTFPVELSHLLALCGLRIENRFGSFYRAPFDHRSEELIIEAKKVIRVSQ
ncbi:class I SAM-dependent methyltransferase [Thermoflavimicrobium daqui]|uniref:SAM-dependent methyltransferase n=1 Tax=Thermoflavimicrobium daqui TaxID=2137476 RepID=A0A364K4L5_9BACL|nr:class I SAM-dependent methyltransferase [Thermoflavimicrobium daqui]RAL24310.1 SAM-dependent methyltransferase [Thermoflavimicrobium daqui]